MKITAKSQLTGSTNTMDIDVTVEQIQNWQKSGKLVQEVFPNLTAAEREFLMTGITPEEWDRLVASPEDEE